MATRVLQGGNDLNSRQEPSVMGCANRLSELYDRSRAGFITETLHLGAEMYEARCSLSRKWAALWNTPGRRLPFCKAKTQRLIGIWLGLKWLNEYDRTHLLPQSFNALYCLRQLPEAVLKQLVAKGEVHPALTVKEARELVEERQGHQRNSASKGADANRRMKNFRKFLEDASERWLPEERISIRMEILEWVELVGEPRKRRAGSFSAVTKAPVRLNVIPGEPIPPSRGGQVERTGKRAQLLAFRATAGGRKAPSTNATWAASRLGKGKQKVSES